MLRAKVEQSKQAAKKSRVGKESYPPQSVHEEQ